MNTTTQEVKASLGCKPSDRTCFALMATKPAINGPNNYPCKLVSLTSEYLDTPDGGVVNLRLVLCNPTSKPFGAFQAIVSPGVLLQGQPVGPPPVILVNIDALGPGETRLFYVNGAAMLPLPEKGTFECRDEEFTPTAATTP